MFLPYSSQEWKEEESLPEGCIYKEEGEGRAPSLPEGRRLRPAPGGKFQMDLTIAPTSTSQGSVTCANTCWREHTLIPVTLE